MNVIIGCPIEDEQTGVYLYNAFMELGHTVIGAVNVRVPDGPKLVLTLVEKYRPDLLFMTKDPHYKPILEKLAKKTCVAVWSCDARNELAISEEFKHCHLFYTTELSYLKAYRDYGLKRVKLMCEAIDPTIHKRERISTDDLMLYSSDVSFAGNVGSLHAGRRELLDLVQKNVKQFKHFTGVFNQEHNKMAQCAKINLGNSAMVNVGLAISARDYRIMGAGGFLLTNHVRDIETWFEVGKMCDTYRTPEECLKKIEYYLKHDDERMQMADYAYKVIHDKHKFSDRLREVIEDVKDFLC